MLRLIFQALKGMAATFRVAPSMIIRTAAARRLPNTDSVLMLLKWLERHLSQREPGDEDASR
jgi:trehalose 6-phosphate synthase/phosphatase